jgi:hypothetical protein
MSAVFAVAGEYTPASATAGGQRISPASRPEEAHMDITALVIVTVCLLGLVIIR